MFLPIHDICPHSPLMSVTLQWSLLAKKHSSAFTVLLQTAPLWSWWHSTVRALTLWGVVFVKGHSWICLPSSLLTWTTQQPANLGYVVRLDFTSSRHHKWHFIPCILMLAKWNQKHSYRIDSAHTHTYSKKAFWRLRFTEYWNTFFFFFFFSFILIHTDK